MSEFLGKIIKRAAENIRTIVLPEGNDDRTIAAAAEILEKKFAKLIVLGSVEQIRTKLSEKG
ncbi:MAG: phosphate acyltransferase, partial [Planctomycetota bacterium]